MIFDSNSTKRSKQNVSLAFAEGVAIRYSADGLRDTGVNSIDINFGPKMGPRCQIENWPIGRPWQAITHWQNWPENGPENWPENWPENFYVN